VLSGLAEGDDIVRQSHAADRAVLRDLLMQKPDRLRALLCNDWIFPDADLGMEDPASILVRPDDFAAEVAHANEPIARFAGWQLHAVDRMNAARLGDAQQLLDQELVMFPKGGAIIVRDIPIEVRELVKPLE